MPAAGCEPPPHRRAELLEALRAAAAERGQTLAELVRRTLAAAVAAPAAEPGPDPLADRLAGIEARLAALELERKGRRGRL